ncbi:hypothetical protein KDL45_12350, partial [bacterium]|nr:hypothetical protein [bacterium]
MVYFATMNPHPWYRREAVAAVLGTLLLALVFCSPMFVHPDGMRQGDGYRDEDWLHDLSFYFYLKKALTEYGQFPLYTHLVGGGYPILGHPSDGSLSPAAIPFLLFKPEVAVRLVMILLLWVGTLGSYWLARERLNLPPPFAFLSAGAFAFSGWFPSFMLTGFYVQIFYLLTPMILHVIQRRRSPARDGVIAGLLLYPVLCQSGNGLPAIGHFLTVTTWLFAAQDLRREGDVPQRVWGHALGLFLFISFVVSYSALFTPVGSVLGVAGALWLASKYPTSRRMVLAWRPYLVRLVVAVVILSALGTGKTFSILDTMTGGHYRHGDKDLTTGYRYGRVPSKFGLAKRIVLAFDEVGRLRRGDPPLPELAHLATDTTTPFLDIILGVKKGDGKSFYHPLTFLKYFHRHLPLQTTYRNGWPDNAEYAGLGLTYGVMAVFLLATTLALRRSAPWLIVFAFELLICMGPNLPGDPYRTFVWGIPGFEAFNNPFKYFNFFIVVAVTQVFGAGIFALTRFVPAKAALVVGGGLLLWPLTHNAPIFAQLLSKPVKTFEKTADFYQIHQIPDDEMLGMPRRAIQRLGMSLLNRERFRYDCMREYFNVPAG